MFVSCFEERSNQNNPHAGREDSLFERTIDQKIYGWRHDILAGFDYLNQEPINNHCCNFEVRD